MGIVTLNRPKALNALCNELIAELNDVRTCTRPPTLTSAQALTHFDNDNEIGAIVVTGSTKAFAGTAHRTRHSRAICLAQRATRSTSLTIALRSWCRYQGDVLSQLHGQVRHYDLLYFPHSTDFCAPYSYKSNLFMDWDRITQIRKPIIAAVNGYALGAHSRPGLCRSCSLTTLRSRRRLRARHELRHHPSR